MAKVEYLINTRTKEAIEATSFLSKDYVTLGELRRKQKESILLKKPLYICGKCEQPLALKGKPNNNKNFYLAHLKKSLACEWKSGDDRTKLEIHSEMFFRVRESEKHKELKAFIVDKLEKDKLFSQIKSERRFKSDFKEQYKIPDVSTVRTKNNGYIDIKTNVVFEIQLTSTYLDVIIDREQFYYENKSNLIWIFSDFSNDLSKTKMTEDDILFSNKKNVFILDEEAQKVSNEKQALYLKNLYLEVYLNKGNITYRWSKPKIININEIIFDAITGKSFIYNFEYKRTRLLYKKKMKDEQFKNIFLTIQKYLTQSVNGDIEKLKKIKWSQSAKHITLVDFNYQWIEFCKTFNKSFQELLEASNIINDDKKLFDSICNSQDIIGYIFEIIYMSKKDKIFDYRFPNLRDKKEARIISMLNHAFNPRLQNSIYFNLLLKAIDYYGQSAYLIKIDKKGSFVKKIQEYKKYISEELPFENQQALEYLFPELFFLMDVPKYNE